MWFGRIFFHWWRIWWVWRIWRIWWVFMRCCRNTRQLIQLIWWMECVLIFLMIYRSYYYFGFQRNVSFWGSWLWCGFCLCLGWNFCSNQFRCGCRQSFFCHMLSYRSIVFPTIVYNLHSHISLLYHGKKFFYIMNFWLKIVHTLYYSFL